MSKVILGIGSYTYLKKNINELEKYCDASLETVSYIFDKAFLYNYNPRGLSMK